MSIDNKFLIISIFLGTIFLGVSATAMETNSKKENDVNISKSSETKETKETKENITEFSNIMDKKGEMIESDSEIREYEEYEENEEGTEENLKEFGYGNTKQEQRKTKEWIKSWGFDNECIYKKMQSKQFLNVREFIKTLIKEQEENLNDFVKEFEKYEFRYKTIESNMDRCDNFYGEYDNYENFEVDEEDLEKVLALAEKKNLNKNIIVGYIEEVLIWDKQTRNKIKNYGQLIEYLLKYIRECKFKEQYYFEEGKEKCDSICDLNPNDVLENEYIKPFKNNAIKKSEEEISSEDYSVFLKDNEFVKWARIWIDMWGGNLKDLYKNKLVNIKEIKEYVMKVVNEDINNFYDVLQRFETYECKFKDCDLNNKNDFFDVVKLEEIIEKENKNLKEDYGIKINAKIVSDYVYNELLGDEDEREEITNYKHLIEKAYENFISNSNYKNRKVICDSNLNPCKFYDEGYNVETVDDKKENLTYKSWKQGKFDIYKDNAIYKIEKEYEEIEFILKMREILEKINKQDKDDLKTDCSNILKKYQDKIAVKIEDMDTLKDEEGDIVNNELQNLKDLIDKNINIRWGFVNYENRVDYSKEFFFVLKQAIDEDILKQFINEIINLTKEEYYPGRFIEKFKNFIVNKFRIINTLEIANDYISGKIYNRRYQELSSYKIPWDDSYKNYPSVKKLDEGLKQDFKRLSKHKSINFSNYFYISIFKMFCVYKLTFFEHLENLMEEESHDFEEAEKIRNLVLALEDLEQKEIKKRLKKSDIEDLIDIIKNDIDKESLDKLKEIFKINSDEKEKFNVKFLGKILELSNNMFGEGLCEFEETEVFDRLEKLKSYYRGYFKNLETLIKNYNYQYEEEVEDVKKIVDEFVNEKFGGYKVIFPETTYITGTGANRILEQFKKIIEEEEIINKFKYELEKIAFFYTKALLLVISELLEISINMEDFKNSFSSLIKVIYDIKNDKKELQIFLQGCLDKGLSEALNQYKKEKNII